MAIDILKFLVLPDQSENLGYSRQTHALTSPTDGPAWDYVDFTKDSEGFFKRYRIKTNKGFPWDVSRINDQIVLDWATELDWVSAKDSKKHMQNYKDQQTGKWVDGLPMFPRYVDKDWNQIQIPVAPAQTLYGMFTNCVWDQQPHYLNDVLQVLVGPILIDNGGTVGLQPTLVHNYFWSGKQAVYAQLEQNLYALHYGWTRWSTMQLDTNGMYAASKTTYHNVLVASPPPVVVPPC